MLGRESILFLSSDSDFALLLPSISRFALESGVPLHQCIFEVSSSFTNPQVLVALSSNHKAYVCGYHLTPNDFLISQAYSEDPSTSLPLWKFFEAEVRRRGYTKLFMHTSHNPRVFRKYGFKQEKILMTKILEV